MNVRKNMKGFLSLLLITLIVGALLVVPVFAGGASMEFSVSPILPQNQSSSVSGYFDLTVNPGDRQTIEVMVSNSSSRESVYEVGIANASTSSSGTIDYSTTGIKDDSQEVGFEDLAALPKTQVTAPPKGQVTVSVDLVIPENAYDGMILGGVRIKDITDALEREKNPEAEEETGAAGFTIYNEYEAIIAVVLRQGNQEIPPDFQLVGVSAESVHADGAIIVSIRNSEPTVVKNAKFSGEVLLKGEEVPSFSVSDLDIDFAPSSVMPYWFRDIEGYGIDAGDYTFTGKIEHQGKIWEFQEEFNIAPEKAREINEQAGNVQAQRQASGMPTWLLIALAVGILIIILLLVLILKMKKTQKSEE